MDLKSQLQSNLNAVQDRIANAAVLANRQPEEVTLVAVTKYVDAAVTRALFEVGASDLGESRPQVLWPKAEELSELPIRWHQIGHLQRNKLRRTLPVVSLVHSVDSLRLLDAIDSLQAELSPGERKEILLEVNVSADEAKHGFQPDGMAAVMEHVRGKDNVTVTGLMCMAGFGTTPDQARGDFARLRELRDSVQDEYSDMSLGRLSMGMSGDFEQAIAEGATHVRIGSVLFEGIENL